MSTVLTVVHVIVAVGLIVTILLQSGKSAGLSGAIAGGAEALFGRKKGMEEKLERLTAILAIVFMATALVSVLLH